MKRIYAVLTVLLAVSLICGSCSQKKDEIRNEEKELTVAISADTGSMDPAGSIAQRFLWKRKRGNGSCPAGTTTATTSTL